MKRKFLIHASLGMLLAVTTASAFGEERVQWEGLCIPKYRVSWLQPGGGPQVLGWLSEFLGHAKPKLDTSDVPSTVVSFSGEELARAIPGYLARMDWDIGDGAVTHLHFGTDVTIELAKDASQPHGYAYIKNYKAVWSLKEQDGWGKWVVGAIVRPLSGAPYYKVLPDNYLGSDDQYFELLTIDPKDHKKTDPPFQDLNAWYIGDCGRTAFAGTYSCNRSYLGRRYYFRYTVNQKNIRFVPEMDKFVLTHIHKWALACG